MTYKLNSPVAQAFRTNGNAWSSAVELAGNLDESTQKMSRQLSAYYHQGKLERRDGGWNRYEYRFKPGKLDTLKKSAQEPKPKQLTYRTTKKKNPYRLNDNAKRIDQIIYLYVRGVSLDRIAQALGLSTKSVSSYHYRYNFQKLREEYHAKLIDYALEKGPARRENAR